MGLFEFLVLSFKFKSNFNICSWIKLILAIQCIIEVLVYQGKPSIDFNILFCLIWIAFRIDGGLSIKTELAYNKMGLRYNLYILILIFESRLDRLFKSGYSNLKILSTFSICFALCKLLLNSTPRYRTSDLNFFSSKNFFVFASLLHHSNHDTRIETL